MRMKAWGGLAACLWVSSAAAVNTEKYQIPYLGLGGEYLFTDSARQSGHADGFQISAGVPLSEPAGALELRFFDSTIHDRFPDGDKDYQSGLFLDYVHDFGPVGGAASDDRFFGGLKPFVQGGIGFVQEDVRGDRHEHLGADLGGGALMPIGFKGWALRLDGRVQGQANSKSVPDKNYLVDYQVTLGLQIPLTMFFDRPVPMKPAEECPLAVVDPVTGRRDCATDSDRDGVADAVDQCPGTELGTQVDNQGCPKAKAAVPGDEDKDGVPDARDQCPHTGAGLQVDEAGCVVAQKTAMAGITFQADSARLTAEGHDALDGVAETLKAQPALKIEIAGHTDNVGSEAYNTLLSQQRADAVRAYLISKGIEQSRLTAVGYGELEPVAPNDTEDGRRANRRVEFRISTD